MLSLGTAWGSGSHDSHSADMPPRVCLLTLASGLGLKPGPSAATSVVRTTLPQVTKAFISDLDTSRSFVLLPDGSILFKAGGPCGLPRGYMEKSTTSIAEAPTTSPPNHALPRQGSLPISRGGLGSWGTLGRPWGGGILPGHLHLPEWKCFHVSLILSCQPAHFLLTDEGTENLSWIELVQGHTLIFG